MKREGRQQIEDTMMVLVKMVPLVILLNVVVSSVADGQLPPQWCIADEQTPDDVLQQAMDWACWKGGADCSKIQKNQPCFLPNTVRDHASYAFNSYWQKFKHQGGSCYFNAAALVTELDPSHRSCQFDYLP